MKLILVASTFIAVTSFFSCGMAPQKSVSPPTATPTPTTNSEWRVYTAPDKSFSVELPCQPNQTNVSEPSSPVYQYSCGHEDPAHLYFFAILVSKNLEEAKLRDEAAFERSVKDSLTPNKRLIKLVPIKVDGGIGRELIFTNTRDDMDNGRVQVIVFGTHRYEILFAATDLKTLESPEAERFFATFKPGE